MGVGSALVEGEDRGIVAKEAMVGMEVGTVDGRCGSSEASWVVYV